MSTRIAIIEDELEMLQDLKNLLTQWNYDVVIAVESVGAFIESLSLVKPPQIILLDILLQNEQNSLNQIEKIRLLLPDCKIIIVTGFAQESFLFQAFEKGVDSYFLKGNNLSELLNAVKSCVDGDFYLSPKSARLLIQKFRQIDHPSESPTSNAFMDQYDINRRESEVLQGLLHGLQYKEIASQMNVSINTVRYYVVSLYKKMEVKSSKGLIQKVKAKSQKSSL